MIDADTGTVLFSKDADRLIRPASMAKLMTMEVVFNAIKSKRLTLDDTFVVSENAWRKGGAPSRTSTMFAKVKSAIRVEDLIQGVTVQAANDGCMVLAEGMAGSEENFAAQMTDRARQIGLEKSTFVNSTGLPADGQQTTVRELTLLALHLWRDYPDLYHYYGLKDFNWNNITQANRNPLLAMGFGADGLAVGASEANGFGIVGSVSRDGTRVIMAMSGLANDRERSEEARKLLEWGIRSFQKTEIFGKDEVVGEAQVFGGAKHGGGVGREKGIAGAAGEQNDAALGETFVRRAAGEEFADFGHHEGGQRAGRLPAAFDGSLQRKAVHDGRKHSHRIAGGPGNASGRHLDAAEYVAATDDNRDFSSQFACCDQITGDTVDGRLVDAEGLRTGQIFPGQLNDDATIGRLIHDALAPPPMVRFQHTNPPLLPDVPLPNPLPQAREGARSASVKRFHQNVDLSGLCFDGNKLIQARRQPCPAAAATSAAKSDSVFSMPSPRA